jgi:hypothetical protein
MRLKVEIALTVCFGLFLLCLTPEYVKSVNAGPAPDSSPGVLRQALSQTSAGSLTISSGYLMENWSAQIQGVGGTGAATVLCYPMLCNICTPATTAALTVTGAGNTAVAGFVSSPVLAWGMFVTWGAPAASTTITINVNAK